MMKDIQWPDLVSTIIENQIHSRKEEPVAKEKPTPQASPKKKKAAATSAKKKKTFSSPKKKKAAPENKKKAATPKEKKPSPAKKKVAVKTEKPVSKKKAKGVAAFSLTEKEVAALVAPPSNKSVVKAKKGQVTLKSSSEKKSKKKAAHVKKKKATATPTKKTKAYDEAKGIDEPVTITLPLPPSLKSSAKNEKAKANLTSLKKRKLEEVEKGVTFDGVESDGSSTTKKPKKKKPKKSSQESNSVLPAKPTDDSLASAVPLPGTEDDDSTLLEPIPLGAPLFANMVFASDILRSADVIDAKNPGNMAYLQALKIHYPRFQSCGCDEEREDFSIKLRDMITSVSKTRFLIKPNALDQPAWMFMSDDFVVEKMIADFEKVGLTHKVPADNYVKVLQWLGGTDDAQKLPLKEGEEGPKNVDILIGKAFETTLHPGNLALRWIADSTCETYTKLRTEKVNFIQMVVAKIQSQGGRFLEYNAHDQVWREISMNRAIPEVSLAFRRANAQRKVPHILEMDNIIKKFCAINAAHKIPTLPLPHATLATTPLVKNSPLRQQHLESIRKVAQTEDPGTLAEPAAPVPAPLVPVPSWISGIFSTTSGVFGRDGAPEPSMAIRRTTSTVSALTVTDPIDDIDTDALHFLPIMDITSEKEAAMVLGELARSASSTYLKRNKSDTTARYQPSTGRLTRSGANLNGMEVLNEVALLEHPSLPSLKEFPSFRFERGESSLVLGTPPPKEQTLGSTEA